MVPVGQEVRISGQSRLEGHDDTAGNGRAVRIDRVGNIAAEQAGRIRHIVLPPAPHQAVTLPHQKAVAGMGVGIRRRIGRAVEVFQRQLLAPVKHIQQQAAIAVVIVHRLDDAAIGGELHQPGGVARRQANVGDDGVVGMFRVNGKAGDAVNLLVGAHRAKGLAAGKGTAGGDVQSGQCHKAKPHLRSASAAPGYRIYSVSYGVSAVGLSVFGGSESAGSLLGGSAPVCASHCCRNSSAPIRSRSRDRWAATGSPIGSPCSATSW